MYIKDTMQILVELPLFMEELIHSHGPGGHIEVV